MMEHLRALAVFAKVVETGSFRAAARSLELSPSVVSHHVAELERSLATPLLYRSTRSVTLSPQGEVLFESAREMLTAAARGLDKVGAGSADPRGQLRVTVPAFLAETPFTADIGAFLQAHPHVELTLSFSDTPRDLLRDRLDLAIRLGRLEPSSNKAKKLGEMRRALVTSPRYLGARRPRTPRDLEGWDFVQLSSRPAQIALTRGERGGSVELTFTPRVQVDSAAAMRDLVVAGVGSAALPDVMVRGAIARGQLVELLPGYRPLPIPVYAVSPAGAQRASLTARFVEFMAGRIAALFA
ncbi:MAG: LysR family transcriptional regulator [Polyangiaceae bacterium]